MMNFTYTNTTAVVTKLQHSSNYDCYVYTVNQAGLGSRSKVKTITTLVQPPVGIAATQTSQVTARITWEPVNTVLIYHVRIRNLDDPNSQPSLYNVSDTKLDVPGILPCSTYLISVSSYSMFLVLSEPTDYTYTTNKLTPVSSVSVDYSCTANSVTVSWPAVSGATSYRAVAVGSNGTQLECTSQSTNCPIKGLSCGQEYKVYVTPMSENCKNLINNTSATFNTAPCPPANPMLLRDCNSDVIIFSWNQTNKVDRYLARAVDSKNLQTATDCRVDSLLSKWDNAEGALYYTVEAVGNYKNSSYNCSSVSNSCVMEGVKCGDHLTVTIRAFDNDCPSPTMLGLPAETIPCTPQIISAERNCAKDSIYVSWGMSNAALFYVAMAKDSNGVIHSCNSMDMFCTISGLKCSTSYKVYVIASNFMCNSSESDMVTILTAPCPPNNLTATLDCAANEALISWHGTFSNSSYTATIIDSNQRLLSCSSTATNCKIPNLKCGELYTVTVNQHDGNCSSMPSKPLYMESDLA
ncbi:fibronectin type III domain-containing protein 7-like [Oreochromis aureus]|uniref:fibronectin type III domain-containing protein 7-like n=1 Tax=Oreochromis aureus TaxID=47969 RepID=UPI001954441A|nr:fibronectin type III domain-containing protein 7-like [Oreochromis aureus]